MKNLKGILICTVAAAALVSFGPNRNSPDTASFFQLSNEAGNDNEFAMKAADGGMYEVQLGQYAASHGTSAAVRQLGEMMVTDHTKANNELKAIAANKSIALPTTLSSKTQKKYDEITKKHGADFDKAYATAMVDDHKEDIALFKKEAASGTDAEIKDFAAGKISVLEHHLHLSASTKQGLSK